MAWPVSAATSVLGLVADGDFSRDMPLHLNGAPLKGDFRELGTRCSASRDELVVPRALAGSPIHMIKTAAIRAQTTISTAKPGGCHGGGEVLKRVIVTALSPARRRDCRPHGL